MKKVLAILTAATLMVCLLAGCKGGKTEAEAMPTVLNTTEYTLYQNIFFNDMADQYTNQQVTKEGTFTTLTDAFNDTVRYYVWGYNDQTKCCDWQWEIKVDDTASLPSDGSLVTVAGELVGDEAALDKYWIVNPTIAVKTPYQGIDCDVNMATMSGTLERVEIQNIMYKTETFEGKTVTAYGRVNGVSAIQHPYYDNTWEIAVTGDEALPENGKMVLVQATVSGGELTDAAVSETDQY